MNYRENAQDVYLSLQNEFDNNPLGYYNNLFMNFHCLFVCIIEYTMHG